MPMTLKTTLKDGCREIPIWSLHSNVSLMFQSPVSYLASLLVQKSQVGDVHSITLSPPLIAWDTVTTLCLAKEWLSVYTCISYQQGTHPQMCPQLIHCCLTLLLPPHQAMSLLGYIKPLWILLPFTFTTLAAYFILGSLFCFVVTPIKLYNSFALNLFLWLLTAYISGTAFPALL